MTRPRVGVLALQGAFRAHQDRLDELGVEAPAVRTADQLGQLDALVVPGGESTTMSHLLRTNELFEPIHERVSDGLPVFGTCAGMILCATEVLDARHDQRSFGVIDLTVRRNGYGRQLDSFETDIDVAVLDAPFRAVFIRAPIVERVGGAVEVLAEHDGLPVLLRSGTCTVAAFHPELTDDGRLHRRFVDTI
ncbi:MAG: pyridoxal 5'-phosphate synthase glutaminase subunit PdxT [Actinomycetota bacterium]